MHDILPQDHPVVRTATGALAAFAGDDIPRSLAALMLPAWRHAATLTDREFRSVLLVFRPDSNLPPGSWLTDASLRGERP